MWSVEARIYRLTTFYNISRSHETEEIYKIVIRENSSHTQFKAIVLQQGI